MRLFVMMAMGEDGFYSLEISRGYCGGKCNFCWKCFSNRDILRVVNSHEADFYENYLISHQYNTARLCAKAAYYLNLSEEITSQLIQAALLHDVGKIYIPTDVFMKTGKLSTDEFEMVKYHSAFGALYLKVRGIPEGITDAVKHHHERYDGTGYPDGLKGDKIPFLARILAVCDAADAMTAQRHYRPPVNRQTLIQELLNNKGTQFDPDMAEMMVKILNGEDAVNV
ncbi:HD-GYP domain-containing protein [Thermovenabulum sp.]|uniref:HD-GYP domain-containing protein n=1 Tax=Thermovenabulum sp. TaxID=3100335 RepID=UPI003C7D2811